MTISEINKVYKGKYEFVRKLSEVVSGDIPCVEKVEYKAFTHTNQVWMQEFVVITFEGGEISVLNVGSTSHSGILRTVARYISGGYYDLVDIYRNILENRDWNELNFQED